MGMHPNLREKLILLYESELQPEINSHSTLAKQLGIARQNINKWINGSESHRADCVPPRQLQRIAKLFHLDAEWFKTSLSEFERLFQSRPSGVRDRGSRSSLKLRDGESIGIATRWEYLVSLAELHVSNGKPKYAREYLEKAAELGRLNGLKVDSKRIRQIEKKIVAQE